MKKIGEFTNFKLTTMRGTNNEKYEFSFVDIPIMNPYYWIVIFGMLKKHESKFGSQLQHLKKMIRCYVMELHKMGIEVARSLGKNTSLKACDQPNHLEELRDGLIQKDPSGIVYKVHEYRKVLNKIMFLKDIHCFKSNTLTRILTRAEMCKENSKYHLKCVSDMLR